MNKFFKTFSLLAVITIFVTACGARVAEAQPKEQDALKDVIYQDMLGKSLSDKTVTDFIANNECSSADQFLLCNSIGMALWTDSNEVVETVYLYLNNAEGFEPYNGELPFGLKFYDNMAAIEYKLDRQGLGNAGRPDQEAVPDHMHYQATYHEAGLTIIYNYPFPDEDATIYAIVMTHKRGSR